MKVKKQKSFNQALQEVEKIIGNADLNFIKWRKYVNDFYASKKGGVVLSYWVWLDKIQRHKLLKLKQK